MPAPHPNRKLCQRGGHPRGLPRLLPAPDPFPIPIPIPIPAHIAALSRLTAVWCPVPRARRPPPPHPPCRPRAGRRGRRPGGAEDQEPGTKSRQPGAVPCLFSLFQGSFSSCCWLLTAMCYHPTRVGLRPISRFVLGSSTVPNSPSVIILIHINCLKLGQCAKGRLVLFLLVH